MCHVILEDFLVTWRPLMLEGYAAEIQKTYFIRQHPLDTAVKYAHDNHKVIITLQKDN